VRVAQEGKPGQHESIERLERRFARRTDTRQLPRDPESARHHEHLDPHVGLARGDRNVTGGFPGQRHDAAGVAASREQHHQFRSTHLDEQHATRQVNAGDRTPRQRP